MKRTDRPRVLWIDGSAGASGDMLLGALVDVGVPLAGLRRALASLPLDGWSLRGRRLVRGGLEGRRVEVRVRGHEGHGRRWREVARIVRGGSLDAPVRDRALAIFRRLFEAEAEVHGSTPERVHLHEAGATDAIVDIVGAAVGLSLLAPSRIVVSPLTTGSGSVRCAHGTYPVPAPATALLVRGVPVRAGDVEQERLTPTGAAILTSVADDWGPLPAMRPEAIGYGAGTRDVGVDPNMLRMILGAALDAPRADADAGEVAVIECTLDDATPQGIAFALELARERGALDAWSAPVSMKKGRAGQLLTVLCRPERLGELADTLLAETPTLGLRFRTERRLELRRSTATVETPWGRVRVKVGLPADGARKLWPEYEDCVKLARRHGVPLADVQQEALRRARGRGATRRAKKR